MPLRADEIQEVMALAREVALDVFKAASVKPVAKLAALETEISDIKKKAKAKPTYKKEVKGNGI